MKLGKVLYIIAILVFLAVFCVSGFHVGKYFLESRQQQEHYDNLASIVESIQNAQPESTQPPHQDSPQESSGTDSSGTESSPEQDQPGQAEVEGPVLLPEYQILYEMNPDLVGWIKIEDTRINYPVMQTPTQKDYYLRRNFDKVYSDRGCIYVREQCDVTKPSDNLTIYGHHMNDGSMFANLSKYQRKDFWAEHGTVIFDTLTEHHTYQIFAVFKTTASVGQGFPYHSFVDAADETEFDEFVSTCKELAFYDTGITPKYGDKLICLSTCEYTQTNGRFVVAAVRVS